MSGVAFQIETQGFPEVEGFLLGLSSIELEDLTHNIAALLVASTQERIKSDQTSPDGEPWQDWSDEYALTRHDNQSLLNSSGDLINTLDSASTGSTVRVGSNLLYAAIHQAGGEALGINIPARPYLGLSEDDRAAISALVTGEWEDLL